MATAVQMPKQGNSVTECLIVEWRVAEGDSVSQGDIVCAIETDKATFDVEAPEGGVLLKHFVAAGDIALILTNIAAIGEAGEDVTALAPVVAESVPTTGGANGGGQAGNAQAAAASQTQALSGAVVGGGRVSPRARTLAGRLGIDTNQLVGSGPQGRVVSRDLLAADNPRLTPLASATASGKNLVAGNGTGFGGRVRAGDLVPAASLSPAGVTATATTTPLILPATPPASEVLYKGIRRLIGERMRESLLNHAQLTLNAEADATAILAARQEVKKRRAAGDFPNLTLNDLVAYVVAKVLPEFPSLNAIFDFAGERILQYDSAQLGIAVDTPRGLMVPVIENADLLSLTDLSAEIATVAGQCRNGGINPDRLQGGTFTITNLGAMGITTFTPVLNTPQVGILGVCAIQPKAIPDAQGGMSFQSTLGLSLTIDHQVVDGAAGAKFLHAVGRGIAGFDLAAVVDV